MIDGRIDGAVDCAVVLDHGDVGVIDGVVDSGMASPTI